MISITFWKGLSRLPESLGVRQAGNRVNEKCEAPRAWASYRCWSIVGFQLQLQELTLRQLHARRISADPLIRDLKLELLGMLVALVGNYPGYVRQPG